MSTTKIVQGQYYNIKWLRDNLFKITPATYPATLTLTLAPDEPTLHIPTGWVFNVKYSYDGITWTDWVKYLPADYVYNSRHLTINKPVYLMNCSTDADGNSIWSLYTGGTNLTCDQNYTVSGKLRYFFQDGKWPVTRVLVNDSYIYRGNFNNLFRGSTTLTDASGLDMWFDEFAADNPNPVYLNKAYQYMFSGCTSLVNPPATVYVPLNLGARKAAHSYNIPGLDHLCEDMFSGCTSLVSAPELPCMYVGSYMYDGMFRNCSALVTPPLLPANENLVWLKESLYDDYKGFNWCYTNMFYGCTSLTSVPQVNFTKFDNGTCGGMFAKCGIKFSDTQSAETPYAYRVPASGTGKYYYEESGQETGVYPTTEMFINAGDTSGSKTPTLNTTYYISLPIRQQ